MIEKYFSDFKYLNDQLFYGKMPKEVFDECVQLSEFYRKSKDSNLSELKYLNNVGRNKYQVFLSISSLEDSFLLPYLHLLGVTCTNNDKMRLRKCHTDYGCLVYDIWYNYCYKGDINTPHNHTSEISGVIFIKNDGQPTIFQDGYELVGEPGHIVIFPASYGHEVKEKMTEEERITLAFNLGTEDELCWQFQRYAKIDELHWQAEKK